MTKQVGSILDLVGNRITGVGTPSAASDTIRNDDTRLSNTRTPSGAAGGDLGSTYPNPTVVKSLADFAVGGNLTVGSGLGQVIIPISGSTAKGRLQSLPAVPNWLGYTLNCAFSGTGWLLDDTSIPGWFFKLDSRAASTEYAVYYVPAGANPHTDEHFVFKVDSTNLMTVAGRITGVSAPSAASDAIRHDDTRLSNARTPTAHAASHGSGQADAVTLAESQVTNLVTDLGNKAATVHTHAAADVASGVVDVARLGTTPAATEYLKSGGATGSADWVTPATVKTDIGLGNVDNTSDANKPVSTATTNALYVNAFKDPCLVTTTANLAALSGLAAIDGVTPVAGDRILVKNQTTTSQNGIYIAAAGAWTRSPDTNTAALMATATTTVQQGTQTGRAYQTKFKASDTLGTTGIDFWYLVDNLAGSILYASATPGAGLAATGNTLSIGVGGVDSNMIQNLGIATGDIADSAITSAKIADGTILVGDLASLSVSTPKIQDGAVQPLKLSIDARPAPVVQVTSISTSALAATTFTGIGGMVGGDAANNVYLSGTVAGTSTFKVAGMYMFTCWCTIATSAAGRRILALFKNGAEQARVDNSNAGQPWTGNLAWTMPMLVGDTMNLSAYSSVATALAGNPGHGWTAWRIGPDTAYSTASVWP